MAEQPGLSADIVTQILHRSVASVGLVVVALFEVGDWITAHLASDWVPPQEVVSTGQQAIVSLATLWLFKRALKKYGAGAATAFNGTDFATIEKRVSTLEGKPPAT